MVWVTPGARQAALGAFTRRPDGRDYLKIKVTAAPEDGKANEAVIALLAEATGIPASRLAIASGHTSRFKRIAVIPG